MTGHDVLVQVLCTHWIPSVLEKGFMVFRNVRYTSDNK